MVRKFAVADAGPGRISFKRLMALEETASDIFESLTPAWQPGGKYGARAFGGHVYAQAIMAASRTVPKDMVVHNVTGHFLLAGAIDTPFIYKVRRVRDGGIYSLRSVDVYQNLPSNPSASAQSPSSSVANATPSFVATVSFKRDESNSTQWLQPTHQAAPTNHLRTEYACVLDNKAPDQHPLAPPADAMWWTRDAATTLTEAASAFPGVEIRKVDMRTYNDRHVSAPSQADSGRRDAGKWRQICFYRLILDGDSSFSSTTTTGRTDGAADNNDEDDLNIHAAAHAYASDRNSLFLIPRALGLADRFAPMGSLAHTMVFRGPARELRMADADGKPKWFVQEAWTGFGGGNRGLHESVLWDWGRGAVVATTVQDGMIKVPVDEEEEEEGKKREGRGKVGDSKL